MARINNPGGEGVRHGCMCSGVMVDDWSHGKGVKADGLWAIESLLIWSSSKTKIVEGVRACWTLKKGIVPDCTDCASG